MKTFEELTTVDVITEAYHTIRDLGWTQGPVAIDADGNEVNTDDPAVAAVCAWGSILRAVETLTGYAPVSTQKWEHELDAVAKRRGCRSGYINYNEASGRTKEEVLSLFEEAIEMARNETLLTAAAVEP